MYSSPSINQNSLSIGNNDETLSTQNTVKDESIINNNKRSIHLDNHGSTSRKIAKTEDKTITNHSRENVGGKGAALYRMQDAGMRVPEFITIDVNSINDLEQHDLAIESLKPFIKDIESFDLATVNIANIKQAIQASYAEQPDKRNLYLQGLANFIASDACYHQITGSQTATTIRENYNQLIASLPGSTAIIVRSSGIKEDNYGDAQAGKFESIVHGKPDIIQTCLQVLTSGFQPHVCPVSAPQPMALIIQRCIDCSFGGVAMSRTSQNDSRGKIEFVPGQPKGGASGLEGVTPHCYLVSKDDKEFIKGKVTSQFSLNQEDTNKFTEHAVTVDSTNVYLTDAQLQQIYQYLQQGEDMLLCPADIEFAIAKDGTVYIVQLRPLTVLTGGVNFATEPPANPLATGTLVSEGFCSGNLFYVKNWQDAEAIPQGAIVVAEHGEDWMLNDDFLKKVGGFIFEQGGTNDHVAITLRQKEKPCLIAKNNFTELKNNHQVVTLACCSFNGTAGAYVVYGSEFADKLTTMKSIVKPTYNRSSAEPTEEIPKLYFDIPDIAYKNLHHLNYKLLDYFDADGWLNRCFSAKGILLLSMAPHRIEIIKEVWQEVNPMFADFNTFIKGYKEFLKLGTKPGIYYDQLKQKLAEAEQLVYKFEQIENQVNNNINNILQQFTNIANQTKTTNKCNFNQLLEDATNIFASTQQLNIPKTIEDVQSIHDCILWIHQRFIKSIYSVAINSGLGTITEHEKVISILFSDTPKLKTIEELYVDALSKLQSYKPPIIVIMENAIIVTIELGLHACTMEMQERAEGGKGRTLKLKLSDCFNGGLGGLTSGKLKRFWLATQLLCNMDFSEDASEIKASVEESTGMLSIEISHIKTKDAILNKVRNLIPILNSLYNLDLTLNGCAIDKKNIKWDFSILKQKLINIYSIENQYLFNNLIIELSYRDHIDIFSYAKTNKFPTLFHLIKKLHAEDNPDHNEIQNLLDNINDINQESLVLDLLVRNFTSIVNFAKQKYSNWFIDKKKMIFLVSLNGNLFKYLSLNQRNDADIVFAAISKNTVALKYIGIDLVSTEKFTLDLIEYINKKIKYDYIDLKDFPDALKNNKNLILAIIKKKPDILKDLSDEYKNDKTIALPAVNRSGSLLSFVSDELKHDKELVLVAVCNCSFSIRYASDKLKDDEEVFLTAINNDNSSLMYAGPKAQDDESILLKVITEDVNNYLIKYASKRLQTSKHFLLKAIKKNYRIYEYINNEFKQDKEILQAYKEASKK